MEYTLDFKNKNVLITGAASGIGLECTRAFLQKGATIFMLDCNEEALLFHLGEIKAEYPSAEVCAFKCDITNNTDVIAVTQSIRDMGKSVDILVNNAGVAHTAYSIAEKQEDWNRVIGINLTGQFFMAQAVANEFMVPAKSGRIINMASLGGVIGIPAGAAYSASKGGVVQLTKSLASEWARFGITVNSVCPGFVDTPLIEDKMNNEKWLGYVTVRTPMKRLAKPEDVVGTVLFLSSDMAEFITGASIIIDGGFSSGS